MISLNSVDLFIVLSINTIPDQLMDNLTNLENKFNKVTLISNYTTINAKSNANTTIKYFKSTGSISDIYNHAHTLTTQKLIAVVPDYYFLSIPENISELHESDLYFANYILRTNSRYQPLYSALWPIIYNKEKLFWQGKIKPILVSKNNEKTKTSITNINLRNTLGRLTMRGKTYTDLNLFLHQEKISIEELYLVIMDLLIFGDDKDINKALIMFKEKHQELIKQPLKCYLLFEKIYFKGVAKYPNELNILYDKLEKEFKKLPEFKLLQAIHFRLNKGKSSEIEKLLREHTRFTTTYKIERYLNCIVSTEDRLTQGYIQLLQLGIEQENPDMIIKYGSKYVQSINDYSKINKITEQISDYKNLSLELQKYIPKVKPQSQDLKFIIISHPRSGSTLLSKLIASHPDIHMYGEILNAIPNLPSLKINVKEQFALLTNRVLNQEEYIDWVYSLPTNKIKNIGSKLLFYQLNEESTLLNLLNKGYKIIYLKRENELDRYISSMNARHNNTYFSNPDYKIEDKVLFKPRNFGNFKNQSKRLTKKFLPKDNRIYSITYNELVENKDVKMSEIFNYLGLPNHKTDTKMRKQNTKNYYESIVNYTQYKEEIDRYLKSLN